MIYANDTIFPLFTIGLCSSLLIYLKRQRKEKYASKTKKKYFQDDRIEEIALIAFLSALLRETRNQTGSSQHNG